jgi:hypothetical protein
VAPYRVGVVTDHRSIDHNPSSSRVPWHGRGCLTVSWCLVPNEVCTEIGRYALLWEMWVDFPYLIRIFNVGEIMSLIYLEKMSEGKWLVVHFLMSPLSSGVVGAYVCLLRESRRLMLVLVAERWTKPPLLARVVPIASGN